MHFKSKNENLKCSMYINYYVHCFSRFPFFLSFPLHSPDLGELQSSDVFADTFWTWAGCGAGRDQLWLEQPWAVPLLYSLRLLCHFLLPCSWQRLDPLFRALYCGHFLHCCQLQEPQLHCCNVCTPSNGHRGQRALRITVAHCMLSPLLLCNIFNTLL